MNTTGRRGRLRRLLEVGAALAVVACIALFVRSRQMPEPEPSEELSKTGVEIARTMMESFVDGMKYPQDPNVLYRNELRGNLLGLNLALNDDPENPQLYAARGTVNGRIGDFEAAERDFTKAIELEPDNSEFRLYRSTARYKLEDTFGALSDLDSAIEKEPGCSAVIYNNRAYYLAKDGQFERALPDAELALSRQREPFILDTLAYVCVGLGQYERAVPLYSEALRDSDPNDSVEHILLGRAAAYRMLGQLEKSQADMEIVVEAYPGYCLHWENTIDPGQHNDDKTELVAALK